MTNGIRVILIIAAFFLASCGHVSPDTSTAEDASLETAAIETGVGEYQIGPGDLLDISVWKEEDMQLQVLVKPDGGITFPLVGDLQASGLTTAELTEQLRQKLKRYMPNPVVTVSVLNSVSNKIYVVGKVNRPGEYNATHYMDVLQALSLAGGLTPFADSDEIRIIRRANGKEELFEFDYDAVISGKRLDMNIILKAGDTVAVP